MSKQALIHIGTGKTGTTSIQESLSAQKRKLNGIGYPNVVGNAQHFLEVVYSDRSQLSRGHRSNYKDEAARLKDAKELRNKFLYRVLSKSKVIISSEFLGRFSREQILALKTDLDDAGYTDYRIICYVRDPVSYYRSVLQQKLKASHRPPHPAKFWYGARETIENYRQCYGDQVVVRTYDETLYEGDVVRDFLRQAEQFFNVQISGIKSKSKNRSLSAEALFVLQRYRELYDFDKDNVQTPGSQLLIKYLAQLPADQMTPIELHPRVEDIILERFQDDMQWLKENYGIDFCTRPRSGVNGPVMKQRNYQLLESIIRKPPDSSIDLVMFDIIDTFLGIYESADGKLSRRLLADN